MERADWDTATWQLLADLPVDGALALSQVRRRYVPLAEEEAVYRWLKRLADRRAVGLRRVSVPRTARARLTEETLVVEQLGRSVRQEEMAHRFGLAEMRWRLRTGLRGWKPIAQPWPEKRTYGERPDALAEDAEGLFVVEYDHGAYSAADVQRKRRAFTELAPRQLWGVSSERRRQWLQEQLHSLDILFVVW